MVEWTFILIILAAFLIRTSLVQTYIAQKAADYLSKELKAEVSIEEVAITFFDEVALDNLLIKDQQGDTLIYSQTTFATINIIDLKKKQYALTSASLENAYIHIQRDTSGVFNHAFIKEYFVSKPPKENKIQFQLASGEIKKSRFQYDDHRREERDYGIDYWHLDIRDIDGALSDFKIVKDVITGHVDYISMKEKSGLELKNLMTSAEVSPRGILLSDVEITTKNSTVKSPSFNMLSNDYEDFKYFVDSVSMDGVIANSHLQLAEVSLFGTALKGMNDIVRVTGRVKNKVSNLKIDDLELKFKERTVVKGDISIPDYRKFESNFFHEVIQYAYVDIKELESLKLPEKASTEYLELNERVKRLGHIEAENLRLDGFISQFVISSDNLITSLGSAQLNNGIMFTKNERNNSYMFERSEASNYDVKITEFNLGKLLKDERIGLVDGIFFLTGEAKSASDIKFTEITGDVNRFDYLGYSYEKIAIVEGNYIGNIFTGKIDVKDDNLDLTYDGYIDFNGNQHMKFTVDLANAILDHLGLSKKEAQIKSRFSIDLTGKSTADFNGLITLEGFDLFANGKHVNVPDLILDIQRGPINDVFDIRSSLGDIKIEGKVDFNYLIDDFKYQISQIFPSLYQDTKKKRERRKKDKFTYEIFVKKLNDLMAVFVPDFKIAPGTVIKGNYFGESSNFVMNVNSSEISYQDIKAHKVNILQLMDSNNIMANYQIDDFEYNETTHFRDVQFSGNGSNKKMSSMLSWEQGTPTASSLSWVTEIKDIDHFNFALDPSYFHVKGKRWDIVNASKLSIEGDTVAVDDFKLQRDEQFISINGQMSNEDRHRLNFEIFELDLNEIAWVFTSDHKMEGKINGWGFLSNPISNFYYLGDANIANLIIDDNEVGDIFVQSSWNNDNQSVFMTGDLIFQNSQTFNFEGDYYMERKENSLDINLNFDYMDIQFANAFMDPDVLNEIRGLIDGQLHVAGTPEEPVLDGVVDLKGGSALVTFLGTHFIAEGPIEVDKYGFYINNIPVYDEDGNAGSLVGSVYHENFDDFNFDLQFDLENDAINKDPLHPWKPKKLDKFLVMNTPYDPDFTYYGRAYCTGEANIFGYTDNLEITVNMKTADGTWLNIPMYGVGEIDEGENFIIFKEDLVNKDSIVPIFDMTGVQLDLNVEVTPKAEVKIIFNEDIGDEITSHGTGNLTMDVDNFGHISMEGTYTVTTGMYNFAMGPIRQKFYIEEGGTMTWTGDPYDADINLRSYYRTYANIADLGADQFNTGSNSHQLILCYLDLQESLLKPAISFDLQAPQANDISKSLIARVKSDEDELNRQFFSLLLWRKFQPLTGTYSADQSAALDLVANQINSLLSMVSKEYKMNVNLDQDQLTGDNIYEFGVSKGFLDNRLIISGSFGVENKKISESSKENTFIGDVNAEYVLNEEGTFRVNIFNESTDKTVIYDAVDQGLFTQGAGLTYKEDFNNIKDFMLIQSFLNIFREKDKRVYSRKRKSRMVPVEGIKEEEETQVDENQ